MKARASRLKGSFEIDSKPHKGTLLTFVIPVRIEKYILHSNAITALL
jgi:nitrate/nitrite-specific signal transduction histidine kinase